MYNNAATPLSLRWKSGGLPSIKMEKKLEETKIEAVNFSKPDYLSKTEFNFR